MGSIRYASIVRVCDGRVLSLRLENVSPALVVSVVRTITDASAAELAELVALAEADASVCRDWFLDRGIDPGDNFAVRVDLFR